MIYTCLSYQDVYIVVVVVVVDFVRINSITKKESSLTNSYSFSWWCKLFKIWHCLNAFVAIYCPDNLIFWNSPFLVHKLDLFVDPLLFNLVFVVRSLELENQHWFASEIYFRLGNMLNFNHHSIKGLVIFYSQWNHPVLSTIRTDICENLIYIWFCYIWGWHKLCVLYSSNLISSE